MDHGQSGNRMQHFRQGRFHARTFASRKHYGRKGLVTRSLKGRRQWHAPKIRKNKGLSTLDMPLFYPILK
jgi:hypothetical protein